MQGSGTAGLLQVVPGANDEELLRVAGWDPSVEFGHAVTFAEDVNGDGFDDVIAGGPSPRVGVGFLAGEVHVVGAERANGT